MNRSYAKAPILCVVFAFFSCNPDIIELATPDWTAATHSNDTDSNYEVVFPQGHVNTLEITMTASDWEFIQADMLEKFGVAFGVGGGMPGGGFGGGYIPDSTGFPGGHSINWNFKPLCSLLLCSQDFIIEV